MWCLLTCATLVSVLVSHSKNEVAPPFSQIASNNVNGERNAVYLVVMFLFLSIPTLIVCR